MKPSHERTPRSMNECVFFFNSDPIERFEKQRYDWQDKVVMWGCAVCAVAFVVILWIG